MPGKHQPGNLEQLAVWKKSMALAENIYRMARDLPSKDDRILGHQIRSAATSIPSNISEGYGRYSEKEFLRFLSIANGSAYEVRTQILLASRLGYIKEAESRDLMEACLEVSRMIEGLRKAIKRKLPT